MIRPFHFHENGFHEVARFALWRYRDTPPPPQFESRFSEGTSLRLLAKGVPPLWTPEGRHFHQLRLPPTRGVCLRISAEFSPMRSARDRRDAGQRLHLLLYERLAQVLRCLPDLSRTGQDDLAGALAVDSGAVHAGRSDACLLECLRRLDE